MKNTKKIKQIIYFLILTIILVILLVVSNRIKLFYDKNIVTINFKNINRQNEITKHLISYSNDSSFTIDNPKIILDPYKVSPLTALIIFKTKNKESIDLYINDNKVTTMEKSYKHVIPVIGLLNNYDNNIKLVSDSTSYEYTIKTDEVKLDYIFDSSSKNINNYFITTDTEKLSINQDGILNWYAKLRGLNMSIDANKNIIAYEDYSKPIYTDFLGKQSKLYMLGIDLNSHNIISLSNENIVTSDDSSNIFEINSKSGKIINKYSINDILKNIDSNIDLINNPIYINHFDYNENNNKLLVSLRGNSTIIYYDIENKEILWILTNSNMFSEKFNKYKLNLTSGRYPKGQHSVFIKDNKLYMFNNDYDIDGSIDVSSRYSSGSIYEINDMNIKNIYEFKNNNYSDSYGSIFLENNNNLLINFGQLKEVYEIDSNNKVISNIKYSSSIYNVFNNTFYNENTNNYQLGYNKIIKSNNLNKYKTVINTNKLNNSIKNNKSLIINADTLDINIPFETSDCVKLLLVSKYYNDYEFIVKEKNSSKKNDPSNIIAELKGNYAVYILINNTYYDTNTVLNVNN